MNSEEIPERERRIKQELSQSKESSASSLEIVCQANRLAREEGGVRMHVGHKA